MSMRDEPMHRAIRAPHSSTVMCLGLREGRRQCARRTLTLGVYVCGRDGGADFLSWRAHSSALARPRVCTHGGPIRCALVGGGHATRCAEMGLAVFASIQYSFFGI